MAHKSILSSDEKAKYSQGFDYSNLIQPEPEKETEEVKATAEPVAETEAPATQEETEKAASKTKYTSRKQQIKHGFASRPAGYKMVEIRNRRVQLVLQPTVYDEVEKIRKKQGFRSFNDFIHALLEDYIENN